MDQDQNDYEISDFVIIKPAAELVAEIKHNYFEKFTKIDLLPSLKINSFINVIGVIMSVDNDLREIETKQGPLKILNFIIGDTSGKEVKVAMWGDDAINFKSKQGEVLKIEKAKLTSFGGFSLSILRLSTVENVTNLEIASCLRKYWSTHPLNLKQCKLFANLNQLND